MSDENQVTPEVTVSVDPMEEAGAELFAALILAQGEFPEIPKDKTVKVKTQKGYTYEFTYATLDQIISSTSKVLSKHGLGTTQNVRYTEVNQETKLVLDTYIIHSSGQYILHTTPVIPPSKSGDEGNTNQAMGSAVTYAQRRGLRTAYVIATDEDDDGNTADGNEHTNTTKDTKSSETKTKKSGRPAAKPVVHRVKTLTDKQGEFLMKAASTANWNAAKLFEAVHKVSGIEKPKSQAMKPDEWKSYICQLTETEAEALQASIEAKE